MKKTLLALAALAASSAAFAQSYVTLYGVMDASVESVKGAHTVTRVSSDNLSSSRIGVKGSEDLGGGTKANFNLESAVKSDTGANGGGSTRFWDRAAWVSLAGGFGELRLGRTDTPIGDIAEIEGPARWIDATAKLLGVTPADYITKSYAELFFEWKRKTNRKARNMTFRECSGRAKTAATALAGVPRKPKPAPEFRPRRA
jgi:predicted porin